jgi:hypothetical protein
VHAGRKVAPLNGALGAVAAAALQVQLDAFPAAQLTDGIEMASHGFSIADFRLQIFDPILDASGNRKSKIENRE